MGDQSSAVQVRELRVIRGSKLVLSGIDVDIDAGSVTGLLGPSGCGKSTLMRAIVGVQRIASGRVHVFGQLAGAPSLRPRVGYVTQAPSVYPDLSVRENLDYFARLLSAPSDAVKRVLDTVALRDVASQKVMDLSGGQRSRVGLATALLNNPPLLVLDEPTVGLDPVLRRDLWRVFHELADRGPTLLVSSHVMDEAERCDQIVLMRNGQVLAADTPHALRARTNTPDIESAFLRLLEQDSAS